MQKNTKTLCLFIAITVFIATAYTPSTLAEPFGSIDLTIRIFNPDGDGEQYESVTIPVTVMTADRNGEMGAIVASGVTPEGVEVGIQFHLSNGEIHQEADGDWLFSPVFFFVRNSRILQYDLFADNGYLVSVSGASMTVDTMGISNELMNIVYFRLDAVHKSFSPNIVDGSLFVQKSHGMSEGFTEIVGSFSLTWPSSEGF